MAAPTLTSQTGSTWSDIPGGTTEVTGTLTWAAGDRILVIGVTEDQSNTLTTPTATGLTFTALGSAISQTNACWVHVWTATAAGAGSSTVSTTRSSSIAAGLHAWAYGSCTGFVRTNGANITGTQTVSVTRTQANSAVVFVSADWSASGVGGLGWTPAGQTQVQAATSANATFFAAHWGDQGATGTTAYGTTGIAGTAIAKTAVEVLGTVSTATTAAAETTTAAGTSNAATAAAAVAGGQAAAAGTANQAAVATVSSATPAAENATATGSAFQATVSAVVPGGTESLFTNQTPTLTDGSDGAPGITTATTVRFAVEGQVSAGRFYATVNVSGTYTMGLWRVDTSDPGGGTLLASKTLAAPPTASTWNTVTFDSPVDVLPNVAYRVGVFSSAGRYVATNNFFTADLVNGNITADQPGDTIGSVTISQGTFRIDSVFEFPNTSGSGSAYFTDVVFAVAGAATAAPAESSSGAGTGYDAGTVLAAFAESPAGTGGALDATVQSSSAVVASAEAATAAGAVEDAFVLVPGGVETLFTNQTPAGTDQSDGTPGIVTATTFRAAVNGQVSGIRFRATDTVSGTYIVALWRVDTSDPGGGTLLASKTLAAPPTASTWNTITLDTPVPVVAGLPYRAGVFSSAGRYVYSANFFTTDLVHGNLTADATGDTIGGITITQGVFRLDTVLEYPNSNGNGAAYFVDVAFTETTGTVVEAEVATAQGEAPFETGTQLSWTMISEAPIDAVGTSYAALPAAASAPAAAEAAATALDPATRAVFGAEMALAGGVGYAAVPTVSAAAEVATADGVGIDPAVSVFAAEPVSADGVAYDAVPTVSAAAETATAVGAGFDGQTTGFGAGLPAGDGVAFDAVSAVLVFAETATAAGAGYDPTVQTVSVVQMPAGFAVAGGAGYDVAAAVIAAAEQAAAGAVAYQASVSFEAVRIVAWRSTVTETTRGGNTVRAGTRG